MTELAQAAQAARMILTRLAAGEAAVFYDEYIRRMGRLQFRRTIANEALGLLSCRPQADGTIDLAGLRQHA